MSYKDEQIRRPSVAVAASQTDSVVWPAESGARLRVLAAYAVTPTATALTFNTKGSGAGVAVTAAFTSAAGEPTLNLPFNPYGWFLTNPGEALTVTTGAGGTTAILVTLAAHYGLDAGQYAIYDELGAPIPLLGEDYVPLLLESAT